MTWSHPSGEAEDCAGLAPASIFLLSSCVSSGYPESVAMLVQIGDHLSKQYDVKEVGPEHRRDAICGGYLNAVRLQQ